MSHQIKETDTPLNLTLSDSQFLKGVALIFLLAHHVWDSSGRYDDYIIHSKPLFEGIGGLFKACVTMFVLM